MPKVNALRLLGPAAGILAVALVAAAALGNRFRTRPSSQPVPALLGQVRAQLGLEPVLAAEAALRARPDDPQARLALARACEESRDLAGAALALAPLTEGSPSPEILTRYAGDCLGLRWPDEAAAALARLDAPPAGLRLRLADAYSRSGQAPRAVELLTRLEKESLRADEWLDGTVTWAQCRRPDRAVRWALRGRTHMPDHPAVAILLARCYLAAGQPEAALAVLPRLPAGGPPDPMLEFWQARAALRARDPSLRKEGLQRLTRIALQEPPNSVAVFEAGRAYLEAGDAQHAAVLLARASAGDYQQILAFDLLARAYEALGRKAEAATARGQAQIARAQWDAGLASLRRANALSPSDPQTHLDLAKALYSDGKFRDALSVLERARARFPENLEVALLKAETLGQMERIPDEERELLAVAEREPQRANVPLRTLGTAYYLSLQYDRAIPLFERVLQLDDTDAHAHLYLGLSCSKRADDPAQAEKAVHHLLRAAEFKPDDYFPWLNAGNVLLRLGHVPEAAACFRRAIDADSRADAAYAALAQALHRAGRLPERKLVLQRYAKLQGAGAKRSRLEKESASAPRDARLQYELGEALFEAAHPEQAFRYFLRAASLRPDWKPAQSRLADVCALLDYDDMQREAERAAQ